LMYKTSEFRACKRGRFFRRHRDRRSGGNQGARAESGVSAGPFGLRMSGGLPERLRSPALIQNDSGQPQGPAGGFRGRLSVR
jgi:hypothetical protein